MLLNSKSWLLPVWVDLDFIFVPLLALGHLRTKNVLWSLWRQWGAANSLKWRKTLYWRSNLTAEHMIWALCMMWNLEADRSLGLEVDRINSYARFPCEFVCIQSYYSRVLLNHESGLGISARLWCKWSTSGLPMTTIPVQVDILRL